MRGAAALILLLFAGPLISPSPALALSEIQREDAPPPAPGAQQEEGGESIPLPGPGATPPGDEEPATPREGEPEQVGPESETGPSMGRPEIDPDAPPPEIIYDLERLPEPVKRMRQLIVEACRTGDVEALRPLLGTGESMTQLSFAGVEGDPIEFIKGLSGDAEGHEILAILLEVLSAGYVHLDAGTEAELYVWPYFFAVPLDKLTPGQRVELFKIVTAGDYEDMKTYGAYIFYRVGITPEGRWAFFVAGD